MDVKTIRAQRSWPRPDTSKVSRIDAIGWLSAQAICGIPEAARLEEEIRRLQDVCRKHGAGFFEVCPPPK